MRNLKLQYCKQVATDFDDAKFVLLNPNASRNSNLYVIDSSKLCVLNPDSGALETLVEVPGIVGAEYLALDNEICLATEAGEVLVVNPSTRCTTEGTYCDVGIECMAWSPDQEVVTFITKTQSVVVMTCTYDPISEHSLLEQCGFEEQFINVGWGKKETQFHGSEGKTAAMQKSDFKPPVNIEQLPQQVEISWRADGAYFAVSFVSDVVGRMFKVFDKEGKFMYISERVNDLQPTIAWRPSGTWIAVPQRLPNKSTVTLFEKNGLLHREIVLPFDLATEYIASLKWSQDSDILTIETKSERTGANNLYLYTIGNYHWYLKQVLRFAESDPLAVCCWDNRIGEEKTLHVLLQSGKYLIYSWHFDIDKYESTGIVAVIDGRKLLLTNFSHSVVPPPMCNKELEINDYINVCTLIGTEKIELKLCLLDAKHKVHLYTSNLNSLNFVLICILTLEASLQINEVPLALSNLFWFNEENLIAATTDGSSSKVLLLALDCEEQHPVCRVESSVQLHGTVCAMSNGSAVLEQFFVQTLDGRVQQLALRADKQLKVDKLHVRLDQPAKQLLWYNLCNFETSGLVALTTNQCLYIDTRRIAGDVTSVCLAGNYLAYTQLTTLHFLRLAEQSNASVRKVERGSKLITIIANDSRTVLQMPRGNLEAINPRVLTLDLVAAYLERRDYYEALNMLRKQRLNLNIICDHNMFAFVESLDIFLDEITNPQWLSLFITDLRPEDFTQTMYASNYKQGEQVYPEGYKMTEKVTYLCEKLCERMEQRNELRFRIPIITAYFKLDKLEKALQLIWQDKHDECKCAVAEDCIKYLLYMVDVNHLYDIALGTYDFSLVLFVAQKSQKDPKEFLPFLNELKGYKPNYRQFKIDEYLKRYDKALQNISACGMEKFDEALEFIKRHELYQSALKCYASHSECYRQLCLAFADHLRGNGKLENASLMYERGGNITQALLSAKNVLDWQRVLILARQEDSQTLQQLAISMVPSLEESGQHEVAYRLLSAHGGNFIEALECLLKGKLYLNAIFEARMQYPNCIDTIIRSDLLAYRAVLESNLQADQELFSNHKQRLLDIRAKKAVLQQDDVDDDADRMEVDECDLLSDTTSMRSSQYTGSSRGTGKTFRSSKNRRKHERKLLSLKLGNPFEDIALIDALYNLIQKLVQQQQHIRDTCKALLELREDAAAASLQQQFKQVLALLQTSLDHIWIPEMMTTQQFLTGPNIDYKQLRNEQRYALINPQKRFKPQLTIIDWEHEILR